jgi:uncharacterized protein YfaS (alpha-2-macroglobulin family)
MLQALGAKVNYQRYTDTLLKQASSLTQYDKLRLALIRKGAGLSAPVDTLETAARQTLFGNRYFGEEGYRFFDNSVQQTVLAYRLLKATGGYEELLEQLRGYFLEKRKSGKWRNTYESTLILETILPDLLKDGKVPGKATITLSTSKGKETITSFPFYREIMENELPALTKSGDFPVYFTAYQQQWQPRPEAVQGAFTVKTRFEQNGRVVTHLKGGEPISLLVEVEVKADADYVMIEVPIPAGCSYGQKLQPKTNGEVHREYFRHKTSLFCKSLKQGHYTFSISLLPRYSGRYTLNPAKAECMYFPIFYGREGLRQVSIQ